MVGVGAPGAVVGVIVGIGVAVGVGVGVGVAVGAIFDGSSFVATSVSRKTTVFSVSGYIVEQI